MRRQTNRKRKLNFYSNLNKGELKDCPKCRFYINKKCDLSCENKIEMVEEKAGHCLYFIQRRVK